MAGNAWRQLRVDAGMSLRELEAAAGVNRGRLSVIERGLPPAPVEAARILTVLAPGLLTELEATAAGALGGRP